ncbi:MAG: ribosome maturation factor RimP [Acidimicrobiia bacterium]
MSDLVTDLWDVIEPYLAAEGVELDDVQLQGLGPNLRLKVTVDAEGGIDLESVASVSRRLSRLIDQEGLLAESYTLEVSSPGLERPLRRPSHWEKSIGRDVRVKVRDETGRAQTLRGVLVGADERAVTIEVDDDSVTVPLQDVTSARTVYEMKPTPKPGGRR